MPRADACDGFLCLKQDIWPRNELDIVVSKSASFAMVRRKKIKWRVVVIVEPRYISRYVFLCTRATPASFQLKPTVVQDLTLFIRTPKITFFLLKHAVDANALLTLYTVIRLPQQSAQSFRQASSGQFDI